MFERPSPGWYLNVVLGFMEAYFLLALLSHKSKLICCSGFISDDIEVKEVRLQTLRNEYCLSIANV